MLLFLVMYKLVIGVTFFLISLQTLAQTTIPGRGLAPYSGISGTVFMATAPQYLDTGRNMNWNLALTRANTSFTNFRWDSGQGPSTMGVYGQSDFILTYGSSTQYFRVDTDGLTKIGAQPGGGFTSFYFKARRRIPFNYAYQTPYEEHWAFVDSASTGQKYYNFYRDTTQVTGYGTVTLNGTVYPDAVLLRTKSASYFTQDTTFFSPTYRNNSTTDQLFVPGLGIPLITVNINSLGLPQLTQFVEGIQRVTAAAPSSSTKLLWPQPAMNVLFFEALEAHEPTGSLLCQAADGRSYSLPVIANNRLDIHQLPPGVYILVHITSRGRVKHRFIKE